MGVHVIGEITGIHKIRMLYLQLLYRCNFECLHCFHGERLQRTDAFAPQQAINLLAHMRGTYGTEAVTFLGGEPFVYKDLPVVVRHAKSDLGLDVEICTNGYRIERRLIEIAGYLDLLRISLEGTQATNDRIRRPGSYDSALNALDLARSLDVPTGVTMTVTALNITEVLPLARVLQDHGVEQLKLHRLRPVGHAVGHPELEIADSALFGRLRDELQREQLAMDVILDEDLSETGAPPPGTTAGGEPRIERIEADPRGALTMSCKAVGKDAHAFWYDKAANRIVHRPGPDDELTVGIPDVVYGHV